MTLDELKEAVLLELQVLAAGETPAGADALAVSDAYTREHAYLADKGTAYWNADDAIPDEVAWSVTIRLAHRLARSYGKPMDYRLELTQQAQDALNDIAVAAHRQGAASTPWTHY